MTIARTAIRLLAVQAIAGVAASRPTIAAERVFDSKIAPEQPDVFSEEAKPTVIVLTDEDEGEGLSDQNGGPPFKRNINLVFDLGMVCREKAEDDADGYLVGWPDTDARLEASLDVLEAQIWRYLTAAADPLPLLFQRFVRVWKYESHRQVDDAAAVKLARRLTTWTCEITDDQWPTIKPGDTVPTGLDILPDPFRTIAKAMPAGTYGAEQCAAIAIALGNLLAGVPFTGVDYTHAVGDAPTATSNQVKSSAETGQTV